MSTAKVGRGALSLKTKVVMESERTSDGVTPYLAFGVARTADAGTGVRAPMAKQAVVTLVGDADRTSNGDEHPMIRWSKVREQAREGRGEIGEVERQRQQAGVPVLATRTTSDEAVKLIAERPLPVKRHRLQPPK